MNRSTIILISILVVLGAIVLFFLPGEKDRETSYTPATIHFAVDSANTIKIEIQRPGKSVTLENVGGKWYITSPVRFPADPSAVNQLLSGCVKFKIGSLISSNPEKQKIFQVDSSGTTLSITDRSGKSSSLIIGKMGPSFSDVYFRLPASKDVYLGEGIDTWLVTKETKDWRDKTILNRPAETIKDLTYQVGNKEYQFHHDTSGWKSTFPSFDATSMNSTLNTLANLRADDFIDTAFRTESQPITIRIQGTESSMIQLTPSRPDSSRYYVQASGAPTTYVISKWTAQQLLKPVERQTAAAPPPSVAQAQPPKQKPKPQPITQKSAPPVTLKETAPAVNAPQTTTPAQPPVTQHQRAARKKTAPVTENTTPAATTIQPAEPTAKTNPFKPAESSGLKSTASQASAEDEGDLSVYTVQKGETMTTVAKKFNVTVEQILKWNLLKSIVVKPGQELYIYQKK